jgi:hypothetical protein
MGEQVTPRLDMALSLVAFYIVCLLAAITFAAYAVVTIP